MHIDDLPAAQGLTLPEWSHLNRRCATVFTDAYVRRLDGADTEVQAACGRAAAAQPPELRALKS